MLQRTFTKGLSQDDEKRIKKACGRSNEELCSRSMSLQYNTSDNELTILDDNNSIIVCEEIWKDI